MNLSLPLSSKYSLTPEQIARKKDAERVSREAKKELEEAKELASVLREIRKKNNFAAGFRRSLGGGKNGH